jgi:hypothetical protein
MGFFEVCIIINCFLILVQVQVASAEAVVHPVQTIEVALLPAKLQVLFVELD